MIDLTKETRLSLQAIADFLAEDNGRKPHLSSIIRWMKQGTRGVRLEYVRIGRKIYSTAEALNRYAAALAATDQQPDRPAPSTRRPNPSRRQRQVEAAEKFCESRGI